MCICENKDVDQLRGHREADQRLCFHFTDSSFAVIAKLISPLFSLCRICKAKTKALISFGKTAKLVYIFVFT